MEDEEYLDMFNEEFLDDISDEEMALAELQAQKDIKKEKKE